MLPFERYTGGGRRLIKQCEPRGDGTCRHDYCLPVLRQCRGCCAYCGRRLDAPYESWLALSVDHVVPIRTVRELGYPLEWIDNIANKVACCRACNEFLNGYRVTEPVPKDLHAFFDLRDRAFREKRQHALERHEREREWHADWRKREAEREPRP